VPFGIVPTVILQKIFIWFVTIGKINLHSKRMDRMFK